MDSKKLQKQLDTIFYDSCPYAAVVFSRDFNVVHGNEAAVKLFGFSGRDALISNLSELFEKGMPAFQSNASPTIPIKKRLEYAEKNGSIDFETEIVIAENRLYLKINLKRIDMDDDFVIIGYFADNQELRQTRTDLFKQEYLLRQINRVATLLSDASQEGLDSTINNVMKITAESVEADRICIYKNDSDETAEACSIAASWASGYLDKFPQKISYTGIEEIHAKLVKNRSINKPLSELSPIEKELFATAGTKSILLIPVFLFGKFWGMLFIENRKNDQVYTRLEMSAVQSAAILIISSLLRNETYKQLVLAKEAAQASDRAKMEFLSRMSHEIRTPLNAIIGMTTLAKRDIQDKSAQTKLGKIEFASSQLLHIINDILDMSKIESGKLEVSTTEFDLNELLGNIASMMRVQADTKNQTLICEVAGFDQKIYGDDLHLRQIIVNLLSNAIKFTPEGGYITLKAEHTPLDGQNHSLNISVTDTGIGIAAEQQKRIFTSFEQADGGIARKFGGTGLGLAISKRLCLLMGGDINVTSEPGKGSTFFFNIPFAFGGAITAQQPTPGTCDMSSKRCNWSGKNILIVEDTAINAEIIIEILADTGASTEVAVNGKIAVDMFKSDPKKYDLILMDVQMPEMDGLEATRSIRAMGTKEARSVPIVAMTANAFSGDVANCINAGMNDHISKPIDINILFSKIAEYINTLEV